MKDRITKDELFNQMESIFEDYCRINYLNRGVDERTAFNKTKRIWAEMYELLLERAHTFMDID